MGNIERWLCLDCLNAFETPEEGAGHWADDEGQAICDGPLTKVVPANQLAGAVVEKRLLDRALACVERGHPSEALHFLDRIASERAKAGGQ